MRVLITNNTLDWRAGSELYVRDVALGLLRRGHQPVAFSTRLGAVAEELRAATIPVVDDLLRLAAPPDLIHGHHHLETTIAMLHFPGVPVVSFCHGWLPWEECPPVSPRIRRYVAVDEVCRERLVAEHGVAPDRIDTVLNFVDLARFRPRGPLPPRPAARPRLQQPRGRSLAAARGASGLLRARHRARGGGSGVGPGARSPRGGPSGLRPGVRQGPCRPRGARRRRGRRGVRRARPRPDGHDGRARAAACPELRGPPPPAAPRAVGGRGGDRPLRPGGRGRGLRSGARRGGPRDGPRPDRGDLPPGARDTAVRRRQPGGRDARGIPVPDVPRPHPQERLGRRAGEGSPAPPRTARSESGAELGRLRATWTWRSRGLLLRSRLVRALHRAARRLP